MLPFDRNYIVKTHNAIFHIFYYLTSVDSLSGIRFCYLIYNNTYCLWIDCRVTFTEVISIKQINILPYRIGFTNAFSNKHNRHHMMRHMIVLLARKCDTWRVKYHHGTNSITEWPNFQIYLRRSVEEILVTVDFSTKGKMMAINITVEICMCKWKNDF